MFNRVRFVLVSAVLALVCIVAPATAEECVEVPQAQFKHCV